MYFINTLLDFKKITSKQLCFQNRNLGASLNTPPQKPHSRICGTISPFRFLESKKRKNVQLLSLCLDQDTSFLKIIQIFQNDRRFNEKKIFRAFFSRWKGLQKLNKETFSKKFVSWPSDMSAEKLENKKYPMFQIF